MAHPSTGPLGCLQCPAVRSPSRFTPTSASVARAPPCWPSHMGAHSSNIGVGVASWRVCMVKSGKRGSSATFGEHLARSWCPAAAPGRDMSLGSTMDLASPPSEVVTMDGAMVDYAIPRSCQMPPKRCIARLHIPLASYATFGEHLARSWCPAAPPGRSGPSSSRGPSMSPSGLWVWGGCGGGTEWCIGGL